MNKGPQNKPRYTMIPITRTPKKGPVIFGNPQAASGFWANQGYPGSDGFMGLHIWGAHLLRNIET